MKIGHWHSGVSPAAGQKKAGLIEKETEVFYDLYEIKLRAQGVCMRINLILFVLVLVLVLVLGNQNFIEDEGRVRGRRRGRSPYSVSTGGT